MIFKHRQVRDLQPRLRSALKADLLEKAQPELQELRQDLAGEVVALQKVDGG